MEMLNWDKRGNRRADGRLYGHCPNQWQEAAIAAFLRCLPNSSLARQVAPPHGLMMIRAARPAVASDHHGNAGHPLAPPLGKLLGSAIPTFLAASVGIPCRLCSVERPGSSLEPRLSLKVRTCVGTLGTYLLKCHAFGPGERNFRCDLLMVDVVCITVLLHTTVGFADRERLCASGKESLLTYCLLFKFSTLDLAKRIGEPRHEIHLPKHIVIQRYESPELLSLVRYANSMQLSTG